MSALPAPTPEAAAAPQAVLPAQRAENLNAEQRLVVEHTTGPLLVLAGAGSGKTRAITERTAYLIEHGIARPGEILQITFTNKAAQEMRDRLAQRVGARLAAAVHLGTFHALCLRILRAHPGDSGRSARFSIYDDADQRRVVDRYLSRADRGRIDRDAVCAAISRAKNHLLDADGFAFADARQLGGLELTDEATAIVASVWRSVDGELERSDALDFDDLLVFAVRLLERHEPILAAYRQRFRFIGVDEYQDTNPVQYRLLRLLAGEHHNLVVVADDDQAIFRFRGAEVGHVLRFEHDIPGVRVVQLTRNYRSTPQVVEAANRLIVRNRGRTPKTMIAEAADGPEPIWRAHADADAEAAWATTAVARAIAHKIPLGEVAILGRVRGVLARIEPALARAQIPYRLLSGVAFYQAREIKAALAHLTLLANPRDSEAFARVMADARRGIGEITVARVDAHARAGGVTLLEACARAQALDRVRRDQKESLERFGRDMLALAEQAEQRSISSLLAEAVRLRGGLAEQLAGEPDAGVRLGRVHDLIAAARAYERESSEPTLCEFLAQAALAAGEITGGSEATEGGRVALSTVHAAKGLEWRVVLVCGMEEGLFPSARATTPEELEEERRLAYVALTRAKRTLALSCARRRNGRPSVPSRFIAEALAAGDRRAA